MSTIPILAFFWSEERWPQCKAELMVGQSGVSIQSPSSCINLQVKAEEKQALSEVWALQLADRISSIVMLKIVYFLASRSTEQPRTTAFGKCLLLPSCHGWAWHQPAVLLETRGLCDIATLGYTWKTLELMREEGKHQGLPICGSEHTLFLCWKHLGTLEDCPLNYFTLVLVLRG